MRALSATELLCVWERGRSQTPVERGLTLLAVACPEAPAETLARYSAGRRDAELLMLRRRIFGSRLVGLHDCPACQERLELAFSVEDVTVEGEPPPAGGFLREVDGFRLRFRLPDSLDLLDAAVEEDPAAARRLLLGRCLLAAGRDGRDHPLAELPATVVARLVEAMGEADPQAEVGLALTCPACGEQGPVPFDIVTFLWSELAAWTERTLREVHALASAYGWSEDDLLGMHPERRRLYLELVGA